MGSGKKEVVSCMLQLKERVHTTCYLLVTTCYLPLATCYLLLATHHLLTTYRSASCTRRCHCSLTRCAPCAGPPSRSRPLCSACPARCTADDPHPNSLTLTLTLTLTRCVLRLLHGCYHDPHPYWTAGPREGALAHSGDDPSHEEAELPRYGTPMHPAEDLRACLQRLTQLRNVLFPGWQSTEESKHRFPLPAFVRRLSSSLPSMGGMASAPSELPYAAQLVEPVADILVSSKCSHSK